MVAVAIIMVEKIVLAVAIGDEQIEETIVVIIAPGAAHRACCIRGDAAGGDSRERAIAVIVVQKIPLAIVCHEQIKEAVVIVVAPGTAFRGADVIDDTARSDLRKTAVAIIVIEKT